MFSYDQGKNEVRIDSEEKTLSENRTSTTEESTNKKNVWNQKRRITITRVSPDKGFPRNPLFSGTSEIEDGRKVDLAITKKRSESLSEALVSPRRVVDVTQKLTPRKVLTPQKLNLLSTRKGKTTRKKKKSTCPMTEDVDSSALHIYILPCFLHDEYQIYWLSFI